LGFERGEQGVAVLAAGVGSGGAVGGEEGVGIRCGGGRGIGAVWVGGGRGGGQVGRSAGGAGIGRAVGIGCVGVGAVVIVEGGLPRGG